MPFLTQDFLESRKKFVRFKSLIWLIVIFVVAGLSAGGFYFYHKQDKKDQTDSTAIEDPYADPDHDILTNQQERLFGTNPNQADTDGDGEIDSFEVAFGKNPNGPGELVLSAQAQDYIKEYIESNEELQEFSEDKILEEIAGIFQPNREVVLDYPNDNELIIVNENQVSDLEKYFNVTQELTLADNAEEQNIQNNLFIMSDEEINHYIDKLRATIGLLKKTPVPSEIVDIHKTKIAGMNAAVRMFELVRDNYQPESENQQFWADFFYQIMAAEQASFTEVALWSELGAKLKDAGGI